MNAVWILGPDSVETRAIEYLLEQKGLGGYLYWAIREGHRVEPGEKADGASRLLRDGSPGIPWSPALGRTVTIGVDGPWGPSTMDSSAAMAALLP